MGTPVYSMTWSLANPAAAQTDQPLTFPSGANEQIVPFSGSIVGITARSNGAVAAGTIDFSIFKNGVELASPIAQLNTTDTLDDIDMIAHNVQNVEAGDEVGPRYTTSGAYSPATNDYTVTIWFTVGRFAPG